jgi:hypothetical protein
MQTVFNSIAVLALLAVVLLLFANAALLKMVRDLQAGLAEVQAGSGTFSGGPAMTMPEFAAPDELPTYVLVVDAGCPNCHDRAVGYGRLSAGYASGHLAALTGDQACADWLAGTPVRVTVDRAVLGRVGVGVTPTLLKYGSDGVEAWRRLVGSDEDLLRLLGTPDAPTTGAELTRNR